MSDPATEYGARLARWNRQVEYFEMWHRRTGNLRLLLVAALLVVAVLLRNQVHFGFLIVGVFTGVFLSGLVHDKIMEKLDAARRMVGFYQRGLNRLGDRWAGQGSTGTEFLNPQHPYAIDLDIFGHGSLFEYVNTAQTQAGRAKLAEWLLLAGQPEEMAARQACVKELRSKLDLRESLAAQTADSTTHINTDLLLTWAARPLAATGAAARTAAKVLPLLAWSLWFLAGFQFFVAASVVQLAFAAAYKRRTAAAFSSMKLSSRDLRWLADLVGLFESESFQAACLLELQARWKRPPASAATDLRRLAKLADWMDSNQNIVFAMVGPFLLLKTQFGFALESWRAQHGAMIADWLAALGEIEALSSLAGYAYEHPADVFPEWVAGSVSPMMEAQGLAHPLISESRAVRNDLALGPSQPLHVISGSNMSGKSTWLRAIGSNLVLAMAGAPVRARALRMTPGQIGASIRTTDSLQEGVSRFYAEIKRLRQIVEMADQRRPLVFLMDEVLGGTNSHDRRIGAAFVVKALVERGAVGLITTHDLALTHVVDEVKPPGANFHFEDQLAEGKLSFDYQMRPGVVTKSNALALMRSIGLEV